MASSVEAQTALARILMERVRADRHPSVTQMRILEETIPAPLVEEYLEILLEKTAQDRTPSIPMLQRIQRIAGQL